MQTKPDTYAAASQRDDRLTKLFHSYVSGKKVVHAPNEGRLLLEAICAQVDHAACVERIVASQPASESLKLALRFDVNEAFLNGLFAQFIAVLRDPVVKHTCNGELLRRLLKMTIQPPTLWNALVQAHWNKHLRSSGEMAFAWLLLELISWIDCPPIDVSSVAEDVTKQQTLIKSEESEIRTIGHRIKQVLSCKASDTSVDVFGPGGRHDNDFKDYRQIAIFPTSDELTCNERAYYRTSDAIQQKPIEYRSGIHLENQFRLLREDFLAELRQEIGRVPKKASVRRAKTHLKGLTLEGIYCGNDKFKLPFALVLSAIHGLERLTNLRPGQRKAFLKDNFHFLKHNSFGCIIDNGRIITYAALFRVEELLLQPQPTIVLCPKDRSSLEKLLLALSTSQSAEFIIVETPVFAYEPVLKCLQSTVEISLWRELFPENEAELESAIRSFPGAPHHLADDLEQDNGSDLAKKLSLSKAVDLDTFQLQSLLSGLRQSVSLIQGPPGTGKSFIGALLTKALAQYTNKTILVLCYTNHALDQFVEDILDVGIPGDHIVRLGSKSTARTKPLLLSEQKYAGRRPYDLINSMKSQADEHQTTLDRLTTGLQSFQPDRRSVLDLLEFSEDYSDFYYAFQVPDTIYDEGIVDHRGHEIKKYYLYTRWCSGKTAGVLASQVAVEHAYIWNMSKPERDEKLKEWRRELLQDRISAIGACADAYNASENTLREAWDKKDTEIILSKRIIACTTTAAAKYTNQIRSAVPGVIVVEEAGEILESHILTAMTPSTRQLVLIGDHKQLRPKINHYGLTVEKGDGYDLNRSLFERLILAGFPHTVLRKQHRMCPDISMLCRKLTYPDMIDATVVSQRAPVKGLCSRVVFIDHRHPELLNSKMVDICDEGSTVSKQNLWEVAMILKIVKYMAQQGYKTADQVVLTPYLGQLNLLRQELAKDNDPVLNDLNSFDLVSAGFISPASAAQQRHPINISTIDNYQGEECDVVIASLTRSNDKGEIGFMSSPERLNVLLSRARHALIILGNSETFLSSRKGKETWRPFFELLSKANQIFDGLPARCEKHPERKAILKQPPDFEQYCPDGGCAAPCGSKLNCGLHDCPLKCHSLADHSKMLCDKLMDDLCPKNHTIKWRCSDLRPASCHACDAETRAALARQKRDDRLDAIRQQKQAAYALQLAEIKDEIQHSRRLIREAQEEDELNRKLLIQRSDLARVRKQEMQKLAKKQSLAAPVVASKTLEIPTANPGSVKGHESIEHAPAAIASAAVDEWNYLKENEDAENEQLDQLMSLTGLEVVKEAFLDIKNKVDVAVRQNIDLSTERMGIALLGNPGTGKTTVARLYAKFLMSVGALPGSEFVETTGAKLANEGVQACKKVLDGIKNQDGGALFIDEAYQLTSGSNPGGAAVLDFLLAEVENLTGKVVFILAGYNKEMEAFFAHNPGLTSRFPRSIQFADYEDHELLEILNYSINRKYSGRMKLEDGNRGLYTRIVARRLGRRRGQPGFGNARAVENVLSTISSRQAKRIRKDRRNGMSPDEFLFTKEDLIGPEPADVLENNRAWKKLQQLIGLLSVKESLRALLHSIKYNFQRELEEKPLVAFNLNKVFLGSPGTGKTTVAKLYGRILADIGLLSTDEVVVKTPADFVGNVLGASEANTKAILDSTKGKILVIDEAYGLYGGVADPYKASVIDTLVAEVHSMPGDDRCVLLLGYKDQMQEMMQNANPGLARRFPLDSAFMFDDFTEEEMAIIFDAKLKSDGFTTKKKARAVALEVLNRMRNRPNFGNAGQVDILLNDAKIRQQKRCTKNKTPPSAVFEAEDFDPDHSRGLDAEANIDELFHGVVGCDSIVSKFKDYVNIVENMKAVGMDPRDELPFTFLFRGPPGTGKTSTARKMGQIFCDMGFLATAEVIECSAKDLIGQYVGQTGPKAAKLIESALGKVLFIDEAYRLGKGDFAKEAVDELVDCITKPQFLNKLVIILAGYEDEINKLMNANPGLSSRFPESVDFQVLDPSACYQLLLGTLGRKKQLDTTELRAPSDSFLKETYAYFTELSSLDNFANGRDVQTIAKNIVGDVLKVKKRPQGAIKITSTMVLDHIKKMISERKSRAQSALFASLPKVIKDVLPVECAANQVTADIVPTATFTKCETAQALSKTEGTDEIDEEDSDDPGDHKPSAPIAVRDVGVTDEIWNQLQQDRLRAEEQERERQSLVEEAQRLKQWLRNCADAKRQLELAEIERKRLELEEKLRIETEARAKLAVMGLCPAGFQWFRQASGYRCGGGSHFVSDSEMQRMCST